MNNEEKILSLLEAMNGRMDAMDNRMEQLAVDMVTVKADVSGVKADVSGLTADVSGLKEKLDFVSDSVVRIEHEHGKKLDALFDGYQQLNDRMGRIEEHVSQQDEKILKHVFPKAMERQTKNGKQDGKRTKYGST